MDEKLKSAINLLWHWMPKGADSKFWPKEETLQGWFAAALVESGYAAHPTQVLQEVHLGEARRLPEYPDVKEFHAEGKRGQRVGWRFDLTVIADQASEHWRRTP